MFREFSSIWEIQDYIPSVDSGLDVVRLPFGYGREWYHWVR